MSSRSHTLIEELLAVQALGGLDGHDVEALEVELLAHGDCEECRALRAGFEETAGHLAFALDPAPVSSDLADAILREAGDAPVVTVPELRVTESSAPRPRRTGRAWRGLVAAAAVVAIAVAGYVTFGPSPTTPVRALPGERIVRFSGRGGELALAYVPGRPGALLYGSGFEDPGAGKIYELWTFHGTTPQSSGCVTPRDGIVATTVDANLGEADAMAVTVEASSCPAQPTTAPILTARLD